MKPIEIKSFNDPTFALISAGTDGLRRILVVDDETDSRQLTMDVLMRSGYEVEGVENGAAGWEAAQTRDYDLIVTDNKMPKMGGVEMIKKLRAANMAVPVIMATGLMPTHEFVRRPWLKPEVMLEKPHTDDELLAAVKSLLGTDDGTQARNTRR